MGRASGGGETVGGAGGAGVTVQRNQILCFGPVSLEMPVYRRRQDGS